MEKDINIQRNMNDIIYIAREKESGRKRKRVKERDIERGKERKR